MNRAGLSALVTLACLGIASAQSKKNLAEEAVGRHTAPELARRAPLLKWNPDQTVLFKGTIKGIVESAPMEDGRSWVSLLVKLGNGGTAMVELGPKKYVDAQGMNLRMRASMWVAGSKVYTQNGDSVILAQRLTYDESRHSFRREDGRPFWER